MGRVTPRPGVGAKPGARSRPEAAVEVPSGRLAGGGGLGGDEHRGDAEHDEGEGDFERHRSAQHRGGRPARRLAAGGEARSCGSIRRWLKAPSEISAPNSAILASTSRP
jgi:hypothetical protein